MRLLLLVLLTLARADTLLAPTLADLDAGLARLDALVAAAAAAEVRLADTQRAWVEEGCVARACPRARAAVLAASARDTGHGARRALQGARAELDRVRRAAGFEGVRPLVDPARRDRLARLDDAVARASRRYAVRAAWHERHVEPWARAHAELVQAACPEGEG